MWSSKVSRARWFVGLAFFLNLPVQNAVSAPQGVVNAAIEWGNSVQAYTYVFSGVATCQNHPCSNARINLNLDTASSGVIEQTTRASSDGHYQLEVTLRDAPDATSTWKLEARSASVSDPESAVAEGRLIVLEGQTTFIVERPLFLTQA